MEHLQLRPIVSLGVSWLESDSAVKDPVDLTGLSPQLALAFIDWRTNALSVGLSLNVEYDRFWGDEAERLKLKFTGTHSYHESFNESDDLVKFS